MKKASLKILLSASACLLSLGALTGCGGGADDKLVFWHTMGHDKMEILNRIIERFQEEVGHNEFKIEHSNQGDYNGLADKISKAIPAGTMPSMAFCYPDNVAKYMSSKAVMDVTKNFLTEGSPLYDPFTAEDGALEDIQESYWNEGKQYTDGGHYSVPYAKSTEVMFFNGSFFDKFELSIPTTWDEMWTVCKTINDECVYKQSDVGNKTGEELKNWLASNGKRANAELVDDEFFPMGYDSDSNLFITLCEQKGISYTTNKNVSKPADHITFKNDDAKAVVTDLVDKFDKGYFKTKNCLPNNAYTSTYFTEKKTVMSIGSTGGSSYQVSTNFDVRIAPAPTVEANKGNYISQGPSICFFAKGSNAKKAFAWKFYKYIIRTLNTTAYATSSGYEPVRTSAYDSDAYKEYLEIGSLQSKVSKVTATLDGRYFYSPVFLGSDAARDEVGNIFARAALKECSVDRAFEDAYKKATDACE